MTNKKIGILLIHGTMGSVIKKEGEKVWPIQNGSTKHYMDNLTPLDNSVEPSHLLQIYLLLKTDLKCHFPIVEDFIYDWRLNNLKHTSLLKNKIASMDVDEVYIVAHSMGGIISKICLNEFKDDEDIKKVKKLITLGTPWKGSMDSVKALLYGSRIPRKILKFIDKETSRLISAHFPSVYQLLPTNEFLGYLKTSNCIPYFINNCYYEKFQEFFDEILKEKFSENHDFDETFNLYYELLNTDLPSEIELHEIIGTGKPTIKMISENTRKEPYAQYDEGDGTVPLFSAYSNLKNRENYYPYFVNKGAHNSLPLYPSTINLIKDIINEKEFLPNEKIFNNLDSPQYEKFSGYISKVACPVEISIRDSEGNIIHGNIETISEEQIQDILQVDYEVEDLGSTTYIIFDENNDTNISNFQGLVIDAYDKGLTSISLEKYENGKITDRKAFKSFEINPQLQVEINLEKEVGESSLILKKGENVEQIIHLDDLDIDEGLISPPETHLVFSGENLIHLDDSNIYFGKGDITLNVEHIKEGNFKPKQTYLELRGKEFIIEEGSFNLNSTNLVHGENIISYFTVDEYDYTETKKHITFHYFHQVTSEVELSFNDGFYTVELTEDEIYNRIATTYELTRTRPTYKFNNEEGVTGYLVEYHSVDRELEVSYTDIFHNEVVFNFTILESIAMKIIKGAATVNEVESFTKKLNLNEASYQFGMGKRGNFSILNESNLNGSQSIEIISDNVLITIIKKVDLTVSFETSSELITLNTKIDNYEFFFKVLDIDQLYVENLDLKGKATFTIIDEPVNKKFKENLIVEYMVDRKSYKLTLELKSFKELLGSYWKSSNKIPNTAILEIINTKTNVTIRSSELKIANS